MNGGSRSQLNKRVAQDLNELLRNQWDRLCLRYLPSGALYPSQFSVARVIRASVHGTPFLRRCLHLLLRSCFCASGGRRCKHVSDTPIHHLWSILHFN